MSMWITGQITSGTWYHREERWGDDYVWEFTGVFDDEDKAIAACQDENYFIAPVTLNKPFPHEKVEMPGGYYPLAKTEAPNDN